jgi:hypothetical protein
MAGVRFHRVQIGSGAHAASYTMGTGGSSPGRQSGRGVTLTTHLHLVPRSRMVELYLYSAIFLYGVVLNGVNTEAILPSQCVSNNYSVYGTLFRNLLMPHHFFFSCPWSDLFLFSLFIHSFIRSRIFLFPIKSRQALGPTEPPTQSVPRAFAPWVKRLGE